MVALALDIIHTMTILNFTELSRDKVRPAQSANHALNW